VQDPLRVAERLGEDGQVVERHRVHQHGPRALPAELDQVGAGGVAVAGRAFGVDRDRSGSGPERLDGLRERGIGVHDRGQSVAQLEQRHLGSLGDLLVGGSLSDLGV
jgi:hypothetical protein